jgi:hypothetical protein
MRQVWRSLFLSLLLPLALADYPRWVLRPKGHLHATRCHTIVFAVSQLTIKNQDVGCRRPLLRYGTEHLFLSHTTWMKRTVSHLHLSPSQQD